MRCFQNCAVNFSETSCLVCTESFVLNLILVHICILYWKPKANFFMEMSLSSKPSNVGITVLSSAENMLFNSRIQVITG